MLSRATLLVAPLVGRTTVAAATTTGAVRTAVTGTAFDPREKAAEVREGALSLQPKRQCARPH